jgi:hypothetical protein
MFFNHSKVKSETDSFGTDSSFEDSQFSDDHEDGESHNGFNKNLEEAKEPVRLGS